MKRTQIQLTEKQARILEEMAKTEGVSKAEIIRRALDRWYIEKGQLDEETRWKDSLQAIGSLRGKSEPAVSSEHDRYLSDSYDQ